MLKGKNVLLGVTGGIAAYKTADLASKLIKQHANVDVIMTRNATEFITPLTFESLTHTKCVTDTFDRNHPWEVEHIALADKADVLVIAPATANCIAKLANGIADDMLTTTALACTCPKIIAPAMNTKMLENPATQRNLKTLEEDGYIIVTPGDGYLACGTVGKGRMEEPANILEEILHVVAYPKDMEGKKVLVTAGPTREAIDPVRYISNHSTGKMGVALAKVAAGRGAEVTLVAGPLEVEVPGYIHVVNVTTAEDMFREVT
ncbi:MAG: bifunctional phosphopantothenoylcysteine decarboxylase/phosphopantothenate--cysteine ligase CoaBC, partial [Lachnospiraceae bacterium]|nr:bifunctional phosphopantothenoylcysteine decarboxylase/phosphopantothenate--cysteine ligase CoaBC [Lachnospiraceae bacterium]